MLIRQKLKWIVLFLIAAVLSPCGAKAQAAPPQSEILIKTSDFALTLDPISQTARSLKPAGGKDNFDYTPADKLAERSRDGFYHLGDITFRCRIAANAKWQDYSTAAHRRPVTPINTPGSLATAILNPSLASTSPLQVTRSWKTSNGRLTLQFELKNTSAQPVEIGSLGIPMVFNNIITGRNLQQAHEICSFSDPYIGQDAGYLQVTRLSGAGPALVVVPEDGTRTPFEGYQLLQEPMWPNQTFEGTFAWLVHTRAYAENEWRNARPWNAPTSVTLHPGQSKTYGLRFLSSPSIRDIEATLAANHRPVAMGIPGYVLPQDLNARLFLKYGSPVRTITADPPGAVEASADANLHGKWQGYTLRGKNWGRARVNVTYADGLVQAISCYVIKPASQATADLGSFLFTKQWFEDASDPFHRSPSVLSYDREANRLVTQDSRVWIAGLGDEGGSGSYLAAAMKQLVQPNFAEMAKFEKFVDGVLWGRIQYSDGPNKYGVRKSLFYYEPKELTDYAYDTNRDWRSWTSWNRKASEDIGRGYNYPHVAASYWSMYRAVRNNPGFQSRFGWNWYLDHAYETARFLTDRDENGNTRVGYVEMGLMEGDIFVAILQDLKREGWAEKAAHLERNMRIRAETWRKARFPFGSEMAWDSTGQEEVFAWCKHFGYEDKAEIALDSILGYMPTLPHWGYNGNARRYWDFLYGGKLSRIERQIHHYGSGINSLPLLQQYRERPDDLYLLRVGYAGGMAALTNIDQEGFGSAAFHSFPSTLKWDAYSGDYGPNFYGHAMATATYLVKHPEVGWVAFGGNVVQAANTVRVVPKDSARRRLYIAPARLWLTLDAGTFEYAEFTPQNGSVKLRFTAIAGANKIARLCIETPGVSGASSYRLQGNFKQDAGAYTIPLPTHSEVILIPATAHGVKK